MHEVESRPGVAEPKMEGFGFRVAPGECMCECEMLENIPLIVEASLWSCPDDNSFSLRLAFPGSN